jgi:hypothetical protein
MFYYSFLCQWYTEKILVVSLLGVVQFALIQRQTRQWYCYVADSTPLSNSIPEKCRLHDPRYFIQGHIRNFSWDGFLSQNWHKKERDVKGITLPCNVIYPLMGGGGPKQLTPLPPSAWLCPCFNV